MLVKEAIRVFKENKKEFHKGAIAFFQIMETENAFKTNLQESAFFHYDMMNNAFQFLENPEQDTLAIKNFRGSAKSTLITEKLSAFLFSINYVYKDFNTIYILIACSNKSQSEQMILNIGLIRDAQGSMFSKFKDRGKQDNKFRLLFKNDSTNKTIVIRAISPDMKGVRGIKYGDQRPNLVILDDYDNDEDETSKVSADKKMRFYLRTIRKAIDPTFNKTIAVGTPIPQGVLLKIEEYCKQSDNPVVSYPVLVKDDKAPFSAILGDRYKSVWEERFTVKAIEKMLIEARTFGDEAGFWQEMMLRIDASNENIYSKLIEKKGNDYLRFDMEHYVSYRTYKEKRFRYIDRCSPYIIVDPAFTQNKDSDDSALELILLDDLYKKAKVIDIQGGKLTTPELFNKIDDMIINYDIKYNPMVKKISIGIETVASQQALMDLLVERYNKNINPTIHKKIREYDVEVYGINSKVPKRDRIQNMYPYFYNQLIQFAYDIPIDKSVKYFEELKAFSTNYNSPRQHDDYIDCTTLFFELTKMENEYEQREKVFNEMIASYELIYKDVIIKEKEERDRKYQEYNKSDDDIQEMFSFF